MTIAARALNGLLMILLPLALGLFLARRLGTPWRLYWVGAVTFVTSQALHLPFNSLALRPALARFGLQGQFSGWPLALTAMAYGLSSGIFEEGARYLVYRYWLREARTWHQALMFGAGHGGIEAVLTGLLVLYALLQALALRGADLSILVPAEQLAQAQAQLQAYWATPWPIVLLGALERAFSLVLHLTLAVLVLQSFTRSRARWLGAAILWHALANALALMAVSLWGAYAAEALLGALALASLGIIFALRGGEPPAQAPPAGGMAPPPPPSLSPTQGPLSPEALEDSRYA